MPEEQPISRLEAAASGPDVMYGDQTPEQSVQKPPEPTEAEKKLTAAEAKINELQQSNQDFQKRLERAQDDILASLAVRTQGSPDVSPRPTVAATGLEDLSDEGRIILQAVQESVADLRREMQTAREGIRGEVDRDTANQLAVERLKAQEDPRVFKVVAQRAATLAERTPSLGVERAYKAAREELADYVSYIESEKKRTAEEEKKVASEKPGSAAGGAKSRPKSLAEAFNQLADEAGLPP